jgi:uncharacterized protein YjaZ
MMAVIQTIEWLYNFLDACKKPSKITPFHLQREFICKPMEKYFSTKDLETLHFELLNNGLFEPSEWTGIEKGVRYMENRRIWQSVEREYQLLKEKWRGPEASIFIFPIKIQSENAIKRNGIAYPGKLLLFISSDLPENGIKSLLAHEYNHVCRFQNLGLELEQIPLKDSLVIEGLGEFSVQEQYGAKWLAPWIKKYSFEETIELWRKYFIPALNMTGREKQTVFMYGNNNKPFPNWIGYSIGYQIVDSFQKKHGPFSKGELYAFSSDEIISGSKYGWH